VPDLPTHRPSGAPSTPASHHTVVFDLGNVLIAWDPRLLYRQLLPDDAAVEEFLAEVDFASWNHAQDAGRPFAVAVAEQAERFPHRRELLAAYQHRFAETLGGAIDGTVRILHELRERGVRLLALTNWSAETFPVARQSFGFLQEFEGIVVSGEEGVAKPDPRIFHILLERYDVEAGRAVYVDDSARNVAAADAAGLTALHFTDPARLRRDLSHLGLLSAPPLPGRS
jgi:2-haloacid dehalogenase